jgi:hypothetical protein
MSSDIANNFNYFSAVELYRCVVIFCLDL